MSHPLFARRAKGGPIGYVGTKTDTRQTLEFDRVESGPLMVNGRNGAEQRGWRAYLYVKDRRAPWTDATSHDSADDAENKARVHARKFGVQGA